MIILGIETSCDETAAAIVEGELNSRIPLKIVSSVVASSAELHIKYGGILPEQAARQQVVAMIPVLMESFEKAGIAKKCFQNGNGIEAIAITTGPGLVGSLLVGVETAKTLAMFWGKPIIPVNHLVAHLYANFLEVGVKSKVKSQKSKVPEFPAIGLVVSGGHTDMVLMVGHDKMKLIGSTRDDAAGECFDKTARILGLPYPGGPEISQLAEKFLENRDLRIKNYEKLNMFPRPLADQETFDWSFSGLKTSVLYKIKEIEGGKIKQISKEQLAAEIQEAICDSLTDKLARAIEKFKPKSVLVAGGVAANRRLKEKIRIMIYDLGFKRKPELFIPAPKLCTDNGSYIAAYAFYHHSPIPWEKVDVQPGLTIIG